MSSLELLLSFVDYYWIKGCFRFEVCLWACIEVLALPEIWQNDTTTHRLPDFLEEQLERIEQQMEDQMGSLWKPQACRLFSNLPKSHFHPQSSVRYCLGFCIAASHFACCLLPFTRKPLSSQYSASVPLHSSPVCQWLPVHLFAITATCFLFEEVWASVVDARIICLRHASP